MVHPRLDTLIDRLQILGLTPNEAKAYVTVVRLGTCRVIDIAREARLQRPEVHHIMPRLLSLGLVEETLDRPVRYRASVQSGISALSSIALIKYKGIADMINGLVAQLEAVRKKNEERSEGQVRVIVGPDNIRRNFREALESAKSDVWMIGTKYSPSRRSDTAFALETISKNHLKARNILDVDKDNIHIAKRLASALEVRHYHPLLVQVYGVDNRYVAVGLETATTGHPERVSELVTTYPDYVKMLREFFDATWKQATPLNVRIAMLQGRVYGEGQTHIVWGREAIFNETADWHLRAKKAITEIATKNGPNRLWAKFEKEILEARARKLKWKIICHVTPENEASVRKLSEIADVRLIDRPFGVGIVLLDDSEAMIHYIDPDSTDLSDSPNDLALVTTDGSIARNFFHMVDYIWKHAKPLRRKRSGG